MSSSDYWENLLDEVTDALLNGNTDIDSILTKEDEKAAPFMALIDGLQNALFVREPSDTFVKSLKRELVGKDSSVLDQFVPAQVQIAAGMAVVAGFALIARRRIVNTVRDNDNGLPAVAVE